MLVRFICIVTHRQLLTFTDIKYPTVQTQHNISTHSTANGHLRCFCFEAITNWYCKHSFTYILAYMHLYFSRYIPRSGITSYRVCVSSILPGVKLFLSLISKLFTNFSYGNWSSWATLGNNSISPDKIISSNYNLGVISIYGHL